MSRSHPRSRRSALVVLTLAAIGFGCDDGDVSDSGDAAPGQSGDPVDITERVLTLTSGDCGDYVDVLVATVSDLQRQRGFEMAVVITASADACTLTSNNIPNHDFNDPSARFATPVAEVAHRFTIPRNPRPAAEPMPLSQMTYNAVFLNGVPLDLLSAGCYKPDDPMADAFGNTPIGCRVTDGWLIDPLGSDDRFGADAHNAHTQPDGSYHYHGNPMAMFDDAPGLDGSPVIGFAADGFPVYGSYFNDADGALRKAVSGWTLKQGERPSGATDPGGTYDGTYVDDWEFTDAGDLDACNGMTVNGQYGYYVTDTYPWVMACHTGTPDGSFSKGGGGGPGGGRPPG